MPVSRPVMDKLADGVNMFMAAAWNIVASRVNGIALATTILQGIWKHKDARNSDGCIIGKVDIDQCKHTSVIACISALSIGIKFNTF